MKKKILSLLIIPLCVFGMINSVMATETVNCKNDDPEAEIAGACYATLKDAYTAANNNDTIKILKSFSSESDIMLISMKSVIIDLAGHSITFSDGQFGLLLYGNVTLKNGTINSTKAPIGSDGKPTDTFTVTISQSGTNVILDNIQMETSRSGVAFFGGTPTLTVQNNTVIKSSMGAGIVAYGNTNGILTVKNSQIINEGTYSAINASYANGIKLNVNIEPGSVITSTGGAAILHMAKGDVKITGGTVTGYEAAVAMTRGKLEVSNDAILKATGKYDSEFKSSASGKLYANGSAIYIEPVDSSNPVSIDIKGGEISSTEGYAISAPGNNNRNDNLTISITNGNFSGNKGSIEIVEGTIPHKNFIEGGNFAQSFTDGEVTAETDHHDLKEYFKENFIQSATGTVAEEGKIHNIKIIPPTTAGSIQVVGNAAAGEIVKVIATPANGNYRLVKIVVKKAAVAGISTIAMPIASGTDEVEVNADGTFVMPDYDVEVTAIFEHIPIVNQGDAEDPGNTGDLGNTGNENENQGQTPGTETKPGEDETTDTNPGTFDNITSYLTIMISSLGLVVCATKKSLNR